MKRFRRAKDIKTAVAGYSAGRFHLREMRQAGMTPVAVADLDAGRRDAAEQDCPGIRTYGSLGEMLRKADVNLVALATPHHMHAKQAIRCLNAGWNVVTEKPFAITTAECDAMIAAAKRNGRMLSTYHNRHWDGWMLDAVQKIRAGVIGDVVRIEAHMGGYGPPGGWWRASKSQSGGVLFDWGVHLIEYALQLIDSELVEVSGFAKTGFWAGQSPWKDDTNEDEATAVVRFKSGQWLSLAISFLDSNPKQADRGWLEITGTKGTYMMEGGSHRIITHRGPRRITTAGKSRKSEQRRFYQNIADHLVKGEPLVITPEWARRPIHIIDLANRSAKKGAAIRARYE